jgi:hypothetical protein
LWTLPIIFLAPVIVDTLVMKQRTWFRKYTLMLMITPSLAVWIVLLDSNLYLFDISLKN